MENDSDEVENGGRQNKDGLGTDNRKEKQGDDDDDEVDDDDDEVNNDDDDEEANVPHPFDRLREWEQKQCELAQRSVRKSEKLKKICKSEN